MRDFAHIQKLAVNAMVAKAKELSLKGVAIALVWDPTNPTYWQPTIHYAENFYRGPKPANGPEDIGANYAAVAFSKLAQMLRTLQPSGQTAFKGENNYPGGDLIEVTEAGLFLLASYSGGTGEEDLEASRAGLTVLHNLCTGRVAPKVEHVSMWILMNQMTLALAFFEHLGWQEEIGRHPTWEGGEARFVRHPMGGAYLQLTCDDNAIEGEEGSAFHVAMVTPSVPTTLAAIRGFCNCYDLELIVEDVSGGKMMVFVPTLFCGAIELVPS